jgi:hypothetical protein
MLSLKALFEAPEKIIKKTTTKNYNVDDYKNPPKKNIQGYRTKTLHSKDNGKKILVKLAIVKDPETGKTKTQKTSIWKEKD